MDFTNSQRAKILVEALPYIEKYYNKIVVIKYGGNAMIDQQLKKSVMKDIVLLSTVGIKVVLIHGGGPEVTGLLNQVGKESEFVNGLRVTDKETVDYVQMVLAGKVNKSLVNIIGSYGGKAVGLSGIDGQMIKAVMQDEALGYVGEVTEVNPQIILDTLEKGYIPVISTVGCDEEGNVYNINADTAAAEIAGALQSQVLISMTDISGVLRDVNDPDSLISLITLDDIEKLKAEGVISGGMIPKVDCCAHALRCGAKTVFIIDGRMEHSIIMEMLTDEGLGTMFVM